ncbi:Pre-mRNA-splicing factor of RES complex-domain-containing protein [Baffinella frigidus]|nr:Pre-mRNA-splicing factor of RES complex-domain-containing protein [Cryptophyta sp. CCMP2293]
MGGRHDQHDSDEDQHDSGEDQSPPRRKSPGGAGRHDSDSDQSPPRKAGGGGGRKRHDSGSDQSPPRKPGPAPHGVEEEGRLLVGGGVEEEEGGRLLGGDTTRTATRALRAGDEGGGQKGPRTVNGLKAGFVSGRELNDTMDKKKQDENDRFKKLDNATTGKVAETVYRDKEGKRVEADATSGKRKKTADEEETELKNMVWGKGLVQMEEKQEQLRRLEAEKTAPFARTVEDTDIQDKDGETAPTAPFARTVEDKDMNDELKAATRTAKAQTAKPKFGVPPGYRWDGVDRSNGFERNYFNSANTRRQQDHEAHMWSTEQM